MGDKPLGFAEVDSQNSGLHGLTNGGNTKSSANSRSIYEDINGNINGEDWTCFLSKIDSQY